MRGYASGWGGVSRRAAKRRRSKRRVSVWTRLGLVLLALLPSACVVESFSALSGVSSITSAYFNYKTAEKGETVVVTPPVVEYSDDLMTKAADELDFMKRPCPRDVVSDDCSAISRMIIDYGDLRAKIDVAKSPD